MTTPAAYGRTGRPPRYVLAGVIASGLLLAVVASALLTGMGAGPLVHRVSVLGLPVTVLVGFATYTAARAHRHDRGRRRLVRAGIAMGVALLLWLLVLDFFTFSSAGPAITAACALACLPTTAFGLWFVRRLDRSEKEPWRLVLAAVAWGAVVATALVIWANTLLDQAAGAVLVPGPGLDVATAYGAGFFEEIAKGLAVLLLYLVMRDEFDGVVDGIVYGAAVGLGFNFMESILYMGHLYVLFQPEGFGAAAAGFQWYARQVLGLFFGHATYTALVGAGIGVARQLPARRQKVLAIACGWLIGIAAHFSWDAWLQFFPLGTGVAALVGTHLRTLVMNGPFTAAVVALLVAGLTIEGRALRRQLQLEAAQGTGHVTPAEAALLTSPWRRLRARSAVLFRYGFRAYRRSLALQQAQLNLAMELWHRERGEIDNPLEMEARLRARIEALRG